jgi:serine/threonine-protein kinase
MVAAAGTTSALRPLSAIAALAGTLALLALCAALADRIQVTSLVPMPKPPVVLVERAKEILASIGHPAGADSAWGFVPANFLGYIGKHQELGMRDRLASGTPAALQFWYRGSPTVMVPSSDHDRVTLDDPAFNVSSMTEVLIDPQGRLIRVAVIPPQIDPPSPTGGSGGTRAFNWAPLFETAGLDYAAFTPAEPEWTPRMFADRRFAWTGPMPGIPGQTLRLEGGTYRGKAIFFHPVTPWTTTSRMGETIAERTRVSLRAVVIQVVILAMFAAAGLIARHNLRRGRGDRRGAAQLGGFVLVAAVAIWVLDAKHVADPNVETSRFFVGQPLWAIGLLWVLYMAVEPYVRRFWPATVVSWSRLMARQWRDPLVGRDVLFGVALGLALRALAGLSTYYAARRGYSWTPDVPDLAPLLGTADTVARILNQIFNAVLNAIFSVFAMVLLKMIVKREWAASIVGIGLGLVLATRGIFEGGSTIVNFTAALLMIVVIVLTIQRLGLVAATIMYFVYFTMASAAVTLDTSRWFFSTSLVQLLIPAALALYGFYASRGGEPLFGRRLLD